MSRGLVFAFVGALVPAAASAAPYLERPADLRVGDDAGTSARVVDVVTERAERLGLASALGAGLRLQARALSPIGSADLRIFEVRGSVRGIPLARPVARVLVDAADAGRVRLIAAYGPVGSVPAAAPRLTEKSALAALSASGQAGRAGARTGELVWVPGVPESRLAWRIDPPFDPRSVVNRAFFVDAVDGTVRVAHDQLDLSQARVFPVDPVVTPQATEQTLVELDEPPATLTGPVFSATTCLATGMASCQLTQVAPADPNGDFLYPAPDVDNAAQAEDPDDEFAEVSVYYHADRFHDHLTGTLGFPALPCTLAGQKNVLVANYHLFNNSGDAFHWGNAAHTGDCTQTFLFGQADGADYAYEGDVVYHEVFHAVTKQQMGPERELGGIRMLPEAVVLDARNINEGLSDLFSCTYTDDSSYSQYLDQYYWAYVPRELDNAFSCPVSLTGSRHQDSELFSGPLWEAHQALGTPFLVAVIDAIAMLPEDVTYDEASLVLESVVEAELGGAAAETVRDLLDARGAYEPCTRIVPHDAFERQKMFLESPLGSDDLTWVPIRPPPFQIAFAVPDGADTVHFTFGREDLWGDEYDINLLLKPAEPIAFGYQQAGAQVTVTGDSPGGLAGLNSGAGSFSAIPGETVFGAFYNLGADKVAIVDLAVAFSCEAGDGCPAPGDTDGTADGTGGTDEGETGSTGAGGSGGGSEGGGCGCRAGDRAGPGAAFGLVVLAARRRRRA